MQCSKRAKAMYSVLIFYYNPLFLLLIILMAYLKLFNGVFRLISVTS